MLQARSNASRGSNGRLGALELTLARLEGMRKDRPCGLSRAWTAVARAWTAVARAWTAVARARTAVARAWTAVARARTAVARARTA
eukprot:6195235-Pleurochrysis_carterae.AAC.1